MVYIDLVLVLVFLRLYSTSLFFSFFRRLEENDSTMKEVNINNMKRVSFFFGFLCRTGRFWKTQCFISIISVSAAELGSV